ncbi:MAG: hypothetical protein R3E32_13750 [Chitinophagales bacterium]
MKSILTFILSFFFLLQYSSIEAQNQPFYAGASVGVCLTVTHLDKNIGDAQRWGFNLPFPAEAFVGYRFTPSLSLQVVGGYHNKSYEASPSTFFQTGNIPNFKGGIGGLDGNSHIGGNVLFRRPIGKTSTKFIGALVGYSKTWYPYDSGSNTGTCEEPDPAVFGGCLTGLNMDYEAYQTNNHFWVFGAFFEKTIGKNSNRMLRFGLNYRKGGGDAPPIVGELYYVENGNRVETVDFYSNGSMLSFEVGYLLGFGKVR